MEENVKIISEIKKIKYITEFLKANNLSDSDIENNLSAFYAYKIKCQKCLNCKGIAECHQDYEGLEPTLEYNYYVTLTYTPCKYKVKLEEEKAKASYLKVLATNFDQYNFDEVYNTPLRTEVFGKMASIYNNYQKSDNIKGLYLHGPYGCGKSYLLAWLASKFASNGKHVIFAFYPDLVRKLKSSIGNGTLEDEVEELKNVEILMIDDIGGESNSDFIRDEVLAVILQTRMTNNALTFMTSNLDPKLLVEHLANGSKDVDLVKGSRIFERIKTLMDIVELKDKNYRMEVKR